MCNWFPETLGLSLSLTLIIFHVRIYRWLACKLYVVAQRSHSLQKSTLNRFSNPGAWVGKLANGPKAQRVLQRTENRDPRPVAILAQAILDHESVLSAVRQLAAT